MDKELKNSIDFINQKVGKNTGFSTPSNYFKQLEESIEISLYTNDLPKNNAFKVPTDYFDTLENDILSKAKEETKVTSIRKKIIQFIPYTAAASVLLFVGINYFNTNKTTFEDITIADIESWYENGYGDTETEDLSIAFNDVNIEEDVLSIDENQLEDYLNTIDSDDIINEIQ